MGKVVGLCLWTLSTVLGGSGVFGMAVLTSLTTMDALTTMTSGCSVNQEANGPSKPLIPMLCTSRNCLALCPDGQLRLAATYSGRVEICYNQRWNTLSSSDWSDGNAQITCIQLGFHYYLSAQFHV